MKRNLGILAAAVALAFSATAFAGSPEDTVSEKKCNICHAADKTMVGPSWKDVAAKYKGDKGAVAKLGDKIVKGGSGAWGTKAMPPTAGLSKADSEAVAKWVLGH